MNAAVPLPETDARSVAARIERLPFTSWHFAVGLIIASAWFFDAVDALAIAYVLPVLNGLWHLTTAETGMLIATAMPARPSARSPRAGSRSAGAACRCC